MKQFKLLVLTDHSTHSKENSLYSLSLALKKDPSCSQLDVASRGLKQNNAFFHELNADRLFVSPVTDQFCWREDGYFFTQNIRPVKLEDYDFIFLRLPHPVTKSFWNFLCFKFPEEKIINAPTGIQIAGNKEFLINFRDICPPMKICRTVEDIFEFKSNFPIVLKPLLNYGGKGLVKIDGNTAWIGNKTLKFEDFINSLENQHLEYLGMQFMEKVHLGDKRIIVVDGEIMGASLRLPPPGSWLCNASQGGVSEYATVVEEEREIVRRVNPALEKLGVVMYGLDTLAGNSGKRVLSEINALSIGGLMQMEIQSGKPIVRRTAQKLWNYINEKLFQLQSAGNQF